MAELGKDYPFESVRGYALRILAENGCDCYTYGGPESVNIMEDLKTGYPYGMKFPYVDVANAILEISKPSPIHRAPFRVHWSTDTWDDGADCESFEQAKCDAEDTLVEWMTQECAEWAYDLGEDGAAIPRPTQEQRESFDYMIYNCGVSVEKYIPETDCYETTWSPDENELAELGWTPFDGW